MEKIPTGQIVTKNWGYCDLSISRNFNLNQIDLIKSLGYQTIAVNTYVEESSDEPKKKKKKGDVKDKPDFIPAPINVKEITNTLNILQRVTIEFTDAAIAHKLNQSENLKKYDIIAVVPKTLNAFQYACSTMDIDIISFQPEARFPFKINRKLYGQAVQRGLFFELMYSPAIRDSTARLNIISTSHKYHAAGKSRNIILTSGAENIQEMRWVQDVMNLGFIFGCKNEQCLEVVRDNPRRLILKAEGRQCGKLYVTVNSVVDSKENTND